MLPPIARSGSVSTPLVADTGRVNRQGNLDPEASGRLALSTMLCTPHNESMTNCPPKPLTGDPAGQETASSDEAGNHGRATVPLPGDLARRVAHRRNELGMSVEELASRSGIDPEYLRYFERSSDASLSAGAMLLMAHALDTSPVALLGGDVDRPLGRGRAGRHPVLEELTPEQCEAHLANGGVGRLLLVSGRGPIAVPVNFEFTDGEVVISTDKSKAKRIETEHFVGFEIDRVDEALSEGWSVLVTGRGRRITDPEEFQRFASLDLETWADGDRHTLVGIKADRVTGRVIVHHSEPDLD